LSVLQFTASDYYFGILWPLYCLSFNLRLLITTLVSCGHCIVCPAINWRTDNTMVTRYRSSNQKPYIEGPTIQWPQDTNVVIRRRILKDRQFLWPLYCLSFNIRLLITTLVSCGHCIVCPSIYGFWLLLRYLVAIVLSVLQFTSSDLLLWCLLTIVLSVL
jgi:hypothetical protein